MRNAPKAIHIGNGDALIPPDKLTGHDRPDRTQVVFNTLVNNKNSLMMAGRKNGLGAKDSIIADNIIVTTGKAVNIEGPLTNAVWQGNIIWGCTNGVGNIPEERIQTRRPGITARRKRGISPPKRQPGNRRSGRLLSFRFHRHRWQIAPWKTRRRR